MKTNNELQIFDYNSNKIRTVQRDGEPWFALKDVCQVLGLSDTNKTAERLDPDELTRIKFVSGGQGREMYFINESGLYAVILRSDKPEAKPFRKWVTSEVLPSIHKTGEYKTPNQKAMTDYQQQSISIQKAKLLNQIASEYDGTYRQVLQAHATKELTGEFLLPLPRIEQLTYSAGEIGEQLGISGNKVGILTNRHKLKTEQYGAWFADTAKGHHKQVQTFRYYPTIIPVLRDILTEGVEDA